VPQQTRELSDPDVTTLLVHDAARIAGYAQIRKGSAPACVPGDAPIELHRFYIDRPWHGCGLSQTLFAAACAVARGLAGATLWLKVWERNPRAIAFYAKAGFVDVGTADFFVGADRQTDRVLAMKLCTELARKRLHP
jgi:GNAT superfamily N-acetyltransferase